MSEAARPTRVAILGGGAAALTTALALTDPSNSRRCQVTVYQMGWRLGGKGASGRNADLDQRIQEHGIHVWFGFYDNAFRLLNACYRELEARRDPSEAPWSLSKCLGLCPPPGDSGAFYPHDDYFMHEQVGATWERWHVHAPRNARTPGDGAPLSVDDSFGFRKLREMVVAVAQLRKKGVFSPVPDPPYESNDADEQRFEKALRDRQRLETTVLGTEHYLEGALDGLHQADLPEQVADLQESLFDPFKLRFKFVAWSLRRARDGARALLRLFDQGQGDDKRSLRRIYMTLDTSAAIATGIYREVIEPDKSSFDHLDDMDLRAWLAKHGAAEGGRDQELLRQNPTIRFVYNSAFSFVQGDHEQPSIAAGAALRGILRLFLTYKGAMSYRMASGMGDVVFSPMYEVLRRRGVVFKFFHRVDRLELAEGSAGPEIKAIQLTRQARLKDEQAGYQPLVRIKDFPSWPDRPLVDQLEGGDNLAAAIAAGRNLEDPTQAFAGEQPIRLIAGTPGKDDGDFDQVVLGIPVAALPEMTRALTAHPRIGPRWQRMLKEVQTTPTQAFQVWFRASLRDLGWKEAAPVTGTYVDPIDTYIDMTPALERELRGAGDVKSLAYFCGVIKEQAGETVAQSHDRATRNAIEHLTKRAGLLWPRLGSGPSFDWSLLARAGRGGTPEERFKGQYARANVLPSERYTLGLPGTTSARLAPDGSGVRNLVLTGDWTLNPINLGCVEATVMSGLLAARAVSGEPIEIIGEHDPYLWESLGRGRGPTRVLESLSPPVTADATPPPTRSAAPAAPVAPAPARPRWTGASLGQLRLAVERRDRAGAAALCEALCKHLATSDERLTDPEAEEILELLRRKRLFDLMATVASEMQGAGHRTAKVRRQHAQALIELGQTSGALGVLTGLAAEASDPDDADEALGLTGRAYKQIYVDAGDEAGGERSKKIDHALGEAIASYRKPYERDPQRNLWHGINLVALLGRAQRDKVVPPSALGLQREALAQDILAQVRKRTLGEVTPWDHATLVEAYVANGQFGPALTALKHFVVESDAFALGSLLRQLEQVWQLEKRLAQGSPDSDQIRALLTYLRAYKLAAEGGRVDFATKALQDAVDDARGLQKILGNDRPVTLGWYQRGLARCAMVGIVRRLDGKGQGTGFLVRAGDFVPTHDDPDELLWLTNAHVLHTHGAAVTPAEARIGFDLPHKQLAGQTEYRVREILKSSPQERLDFTLAALTPKVRGPIDALFPFAPAAPQRPAPDQDSPGSAPSPERLYIIGHPQGRPLELSLHDNQLLDVDDDFLQYHTPTEPGMSGSPVFNAAWELVGLHHAGGQLQRLGGERGNRTANEGIRIDRIRAAIRG